jgi:hypothetical protein
MFLLAAGLVGAIILYFMRRNAALAKERAQHHLASMLISVAAGQQEVEKADILELLRSKRYSRAHVAVRVNHAVSLAKSAVPRALYDRVVVLAREIIAEV